MQAGPKRAKAGGDFKAQGLGFRGLGFRLKPGGGPLMLMKAWWPKVDPWLMNPFLSRALAKGYRSPSKYYSMDDRIASKAGNWISGQEYTMLYRLTTAKQVLY